MRPTRVRDLLVVAVVALVLSLAVARAEGTSLPALPVSAVVTLVVVALVELPLAVSVRQRLAGRPRTRPILPLTVARTAALAQASSLLGALAVGAWSGLLVDRLTRLGTVQAARGDAVVAGAGLAAGALVVLAAMRLEGVCRVRPPRG